MLWVQLVASVAGIAGCTALNYKSPPTGLGIGVKFLSMLGSGAFGWMAGLAVGHLIVG